MSFFVNDAVQVVYTNNLGGGDDGALQEAALEQRAAKTAASLGGPPPSPLDPLQEASLNAKSAASGQINDLAFLDVDTCFWQVATQEWLQHEAFDASSIQPGIGQGIRGIEGRRWLVAACENKVTMHDLMSSHSIDISRSAAFDSKQPTKLAFLLLNAPSLTGSSGLGAGSFVHLSPLLAVGVSSGSIYLISPASGTVFAKLSGGHRGAITSLTVLAGGVSGQGGGWSADRLLSTSSDGSIALWDPSRTAVRGADREIGPIRTFKAHDGGVRAATLFLAYSSDPPEKPLLRLATVGDDKKLKLWDAAGGNWAAVNKLQPLPKASCHSVCFAPWGSSGLGTQPSLVVASGDSTTILGLNPTSGHIIPLIDLNGIVDPGQKKVPKVYHIAVHPTRPHLMAASINTGLLLLTANARENPAVVALPSQVVTLEALVGAANVDESSPEKKEEEKKKAPPPPPPSRGAAGFSYVVAIGGKLWSTAIRMESRQKEDGSPGRTVVLDSAKKEAIAVLDDPGRPKLASSLTGRSLSAVWPESKKYTVFSLAPTGKWEVLDKGPGICLVWASTAPMYACLSVPEVAAPVKSGPKRIGGFLGKMFFGDSFARKEMESTPATTGATTGATPGATTGANINSTPTVDGAQTTQQGTVDGQPIEQNVSGKERDKDKDKTQMVQEPAKPVVQVSIKVKVHVVDEENASHFVAAHDLQLNGAQPVLLHGGALLGVVAIDPTSSERALRLFSWRDFKAVGPALPEPRWIAWEPECTLAALAYEHTVELCRVQPGFQRFATISLPGSGAGLWQSRQLYVSTPTSIHVVFADPVQEFVQEITLASFQGGSFSTLSTLSTYAADIGSKEPQGPPLPPPAMRPAGAVTLAGVRHSYLWLADAFGRPFLVPLRHPGLRFRCLAARGELTTARTIAERGLAQAYHDDVALFLTAMSPPPVSDGVKESLLLPGLSPATEMTLSIRIGAWDRAAKCFQAIVLGVSDPGLLSLASGQRDAEDGTAFDGTFDGWNMIGSGGGGADRAARVESILQEHEDTSTKVGDDGDDDDGNNGDGGVNEEEEEEEKEEKTKSKKGGEREDDQGEESDEEEEFIDPVQWDTYRHIGTSRSEDDNEAMDTTSVNFAMLAHPDPTEVARVSAAARLGMRFADTAVSAGRTDAARDALGVLVRFAPLLPSDLLEELVVRIGRCRMTESARNLVAAASISRPGSALRSPNVVALLVALSGVGGRSAVGSTLMDADAAAHVRGDAVQSMLIASGLAPLAAVYSAVWDQGNLDLAVQKWEGLVRAGRGGGGRDAVRVTPPVG